MTYQFRGLRCRPGDLAVIVQDEPECQANIGQLVRVVCVSYEFPDELGFQWEIQPLSSTRTNPPKPFALHCVDIDIGLFDCSEIYEKTQKNL